MAQATPTPALGATVTVTANGNVRASAAQANVPSGTFVFTNTSEVDETIASVSVDIGNVAVWGLGTVFGSPISRLFASMTLTCTSCTGTPSITLAGAPLLNFFDFAAAYSPGIVIPAGDSATFALTATIAANPAMIDRGVAYAAMLEPTDPGNGVGQLGAAFCAIGLVMMVLPASDRRRASLVLVLAVALTATQVGCGSSSSNNPKSSTQAVTAIAATNGEGTVVVGGLPATLGTITIP
ncbi:MAG: hypothetical protein ABSD31_06380 [Candidatus Binataceae bacterium]|jgi:hypothetical protein